MLLIWDGLQVQIPRTMEPVILDRGFIRLVGPELPTVELRFAPEKRPFDPHKDPRRILRAAELSGQTLDPCGEPWAQRLPGNLYTSDRLSLLQFRDSRGLVAILFSAPPPPNMAQTILTSLHWVSPRTWRRWCCYDITFETPPDYALDKAVFRPGRFHLTFTHGPGKLIFDRLAPANVLLDHTNLVAWCRQYLGDGADSGTTIVSVGDTEVDVFTKPSYFYRTLPWLPGLHPPLRGKIRHVVEGNKILVVTEQGPEMTAATYHRILTSYAITPSLQS